MLSFFNWLGDIITMAWQFLLNMIKSIITLTSSLVGAAVLPQQLPGLTVSILGSSVIMVSAIAIIKVLIGRDNN